MKKYILAKDYFKNHSIDFQKIILSKIDNILLEEHSPFELPDIEEALKLIEKHKNNSITILWDFDADWITSTSILMIWLQELLNNKQIYFKVPEREDWHWLNKENIDIAIKNKSKLIITCDNASNDIEMINYAKENWIDIIITDHHEIENWNENLDFPLINAWRKNTYPCPYLCWAWVAYKVLQAIEMKYNKKISENNLEKIRMLLVIWTIADKVKLKDENLFFILNYRKYFENPKNLFFKTLLNLIEYDKTNWSWFWFTICPIFNVAWRLWKSNALIEVIVNWENYNNLEEVLQYFISLNEKRKELTKAWEEYSINSWIINKQKFSSFIFHPDIPSWLKRLIWNKFLDNKISFCWNIKDWIIHCSVTNQLNANVLNFLKDKHYTTNAWWHYKAFWYSFKEEFKEEFIKDLHNFLLDREKELFDFHEDTIKIENPIKELDLNFVKELNQFIWSSWVEEPIFESNLIINNLFVLKWEHLKITFENKLNWMKFFDNNKNWEYKLGKLKNIKYFPSINNWKGKETLQLMIK